MGDSTQPPTDTSTTRMPDDTQTTNVSARLLPSARQWATIRSIATWAAKAGLKGTSRPGTAAMKILLGLEHGLTPGVSLQEVQLVDSKLSLTAALQAALMHKSPDHHIEIKTMSQDKCVIEARRDGQPPQLFELTYEQALERGYTKTGTGQTKPAWNHSRANMLLHRTITTIAKLFFPDLFLGIGYTPDELGADVDEDGRAIEEDAPPPDSDDGIMDQVAPAPTTQDSTNATKQRDPDQPEPNSTRPHPIAAPPDPTKTPSGFTDPQPLAVTPAPTTQPDGFVAPATPDKGTDTTPDTSSTTPATPTRVDAIPPNVIREISTLFAVLHTHKIIQHQSDWNAFLTQHFHGVTSIDDMNAVQGTLLLSMLKPLTKILHELPLPPAFDYKLMPDTPAGLLKLNGPQLRDLLDAILKEKTPFKKELGETGN